MPCCPSSWSHFHLSLFSCQFLRSGEQMNKRSDKAGVWRTQSLYRWERDKGCKKSPQKSNPLTATYLRLRVRGRAPASTPLISQFCRVPASSSSSSSSSSSIRSHNTLCNTLQIFMSYSPAPFVCLFATLANLQICPPFSFPCRTQTHRLDSTFGRRHTFFFFFIFPARLRWLLSIATECVWSRQQHSGSIHVKGLVLWGPVSSTRVVLLIIVASNSIVSCIWLCCWLIAFFFYLFFFFFSQGHRLECCRSLLGHR